MDLAQVIIAFKMFLAIVCLFREGKARNYKNVLVSLHQRRDELAAHHCDKSVLVTLSALDLPAFPSSTVVI